jgi:hypothetical protein
MIPWFIPWIAAAIPLIFVASGLALAVKAVGFVILAAGLVRT